MENPAISDILTAGLAFVAIYVAKKEYEQASQLFAAPSQKHPTPPRTLNLDNLDSPDIDDTSSSYKGPQSYITANTGMGWHANCGDSSNNIPAKLWCWIYNNQPFTPTLKALGMNNLVQRPPVVSSSSQFPAKKDWAQFSVTPSGYYYNAGYAQPGGSAQQVAPTNAGTPLWGGGEMPLNPAFMFWYLEDALKNICIVAAGVPICF